MADSIEGKQSLLQGRTDIVFPVQYRRIFIPQTELTITETDQSNLLQQLQTEWNHLLSQSFDRIQHCVNQLSADQVWWRPGSGQNSIGILLRHLAGNLNQWIVDGVPQRDNNRDRAAEFESETQTSPELLMQQLCHVVAEVRGVLTDVTVEQLSHPLEIQGFKLTVLGAIMHSIPHFVGHTHQIVQLTRLQLKDNYQFHWDPDADRNAVPV